MDDALHLVAGKSVAVVGNSEMLFDKPDGPAIDGHDVVLRINLGLPWKLQGHRKNIGYRTDIWATARYFAAAEPENCKLILWMKLTDLGKVELSYLLQSHPVAPVAVWGDDLERECRHFVGASPSTGIRMLWWLKTKSAAASVGAYGFDQWKRPCVWSNTTHHWNHEPEKERLAMEALGFRCEPAP
jgi:hypothetical protein